MVVVPLPTRLRQQYAEQGFVIIPGLIPPSSFAELQQAAERAIERTRKGSWPHRRVVGKQFPPYDSANPDSWGVQHVMHPDLGEKAFARWYTSEEVRAVVRELLGCEDENLQMELFNMLINPTEHDFALRWHRDDVKENATEEEEREALGIWHYGVQWNTALYDDSCLYVVPGSHKTPRTPEQRKHSSTSEAPKDPMDMPGAIQVTIKAGETVFYNSNILHCATYSRAQQRATLHATMGDTRGGATRARNILQHGLDWMKSEQFRETLDEKGRAMLGRLVKMQDSVNGDVGYSLAN
ncbi:hypothetical protein GLOTRDRAFT_79428 [Gloeophyllum trabeum ATCC 11539]|uniref:Phytanoyl-CoA dioxygenase family protein n=1 Tax=Gloeophyllum trabeum (strain ATCC 11539 / FP-39264 / Madison 617) TaxID=670483 RepID=S7RKV4_GLOTA|nr:uncharacterized protein GLOTRDRAFT_79428 [Gloeophyllum trabeum ATCC 11539]EPQ53304.1 hypothetical protein GLOTRDRAFT_79428 [Gloeophyllum trabeum ATCC 11539]